MLRFASLLAFAAFAFAVPGGAAGKETSLRPFIDFVSGPYLSFSDDIIVAREDVDNTAGNPSDDDLKRLEYERLGMKTHSKLGLQASLPLEDGWAVKAKAQWDIDMNPDEYYLALNHPDFGELLVGSDDHVAFAFHTGPKSFTPGGSATYLDSPDIYPAARKSAPTSTYAEGDDSNLIAYRTPEIAGFQAGFSYVFDNDQAGEEGKRNLTATDCSVSDNSAGNGTLNCDDTPETEQLVSLAARYQAGWGEARALTFSAGFLSGSGGSKAEVLSLGVRYADRVAAGQFYLGAAFATKEAAKGCSGQCTVYTIGGAYARDQYIAGAAVLVSEHEDVGETMTVQLGGRYKMGSHVKAGLDLRYIRDEEEGAESEIVESFALGFLLAVNY